MSDAWPTLYSDPQLFAYCEACGTLFLNVVGNKLAHVCGHSTGQVCIPESGERYVEVTSPERKLLETQVARRVLRCR